MLGAWPVPSHYLNQCWNIVNWDPGNKLQWNINQNSWIFIQENPSQNVVWKMAAILSRPQCVNWTMAPHFSEISITYNISRAHSSIVVDFAQSLSSYSYWGICVMVSVVVKQHWHIRRVDTQIARLMGPTWDPSGADRTQVGPMLSPWTLLGSRWWHQCQIKNNRIVL